MYGKRRTHGWSVLPPGCSALPPGRTALLRGLTALLMLVSAAWPAYAGPADDQYAVASSHYRRGRWDLAVDELQSFLSKYPTHGRASTVIFLLGESLMQSGQFDQAVEQFERMLREHPDHEFARQARFRLGEAAYLQGQDPRALEHLEAFRRQHPADPLNAYALAYLGDLHLRAGDAKSAEGSYSESLRQFPESALANECRFGLGKACHQLGELKSAERFYRVLTLQPDAPLADDASLQLATLYLDQGLHADARQVLENFPRQYADSPLRARALYLQARSHLAESQWAEAERLLQEGLQSCQDAELASAMAFERGQTLRKLGKLAAADSQFDELRRQWPQTQWASEALEARVRLALEMHNHEAVETLAAEFSQTYAGHRLASSVADMRGRSLLERQRYDAAAAVFRDLLGSLTADPRQAAEGDMAVADSESRLRDTAGYYLAVCELGAGRFEACLEALEQIAPGELPGGLEAGILASRASALMGLRRYAEASAALREFLERHAEHKDAIRCRSQLIMALAHQGQLEEADRLYEAFRSEVGRAERDELWVRTTLFLAEASYEHGRNQRAGALYGALREDPRAAAFRSRVLSGLAWAAIRGEELETAQEALATLLKEFPDDPRGAEFALMHAVIWQRQGKPDEAVAAYREVFERFADSPQAPEALLAAGQIEQERGRISEAEGLLRLAAERFPQYSRADAVHYLWAWTLHDLQRPEQADHVFGLLAANYPRSGYWADATYRLAERAARGGDLERAAELAARLVASEAEQNVRCHALYLQGQVAASRGRWDQVELAMGKLQREFPEAELRLPAEYWRAESAYRRGQLDVAGERFGQLAERIDGRTESWLGMIPLRQAQVLAHQRKWEEAEQIAAGIAARFPGFRQQYEVDYLLGRCHGSRGQFAAAREAYGRVIRSPEGGRSETAAMAQWMIGETHFHQKDYEQAIKAYHRVETLFPFPRWQAAALLQAGKCHEVQQQWNEALALYAQLLKEYPETRFTEEASRRLRQVTDRSPTTPR